MTKKEFQINLNTAYLKRLRNKVNENRNISYEKKYKKLRAWDKICAIMDRLNDTVNFLNELKLNTGKYQNSAFDFFIFMDSASVVVDCINELAKVFDVPVDTINDTNNIFKKLGRDGKGTDKKYFEYLRSLCSVHPVETSRHKRYQDNDFECCPFVLWNNISIGPDKCDIYAVVYTSADELINKRVPIYISQIFEYVKTRLEFVDVITDTIAQYHNQIINKFKNRPIKKEKEFDNYIDYLENLKQELTERFGSDNSYLFDYTIGLFGLKISDPENKSKMQLYLNALKFALKFEYNRLQNMGDEGPKNNGIIHPQKDYATFLFIELCSPGSGSDEQRQYHYNWEKISYLNYDSGIENKRWAYVQLSDALPFLNKYVTFNGANGDFEHYALVMLALYLDCLGNECLLNKNIPNDLKYRRRKLSSDEWNKLLSE